MLDGWTARRKPGVDSRHARLKTTQSDKTALDDFGRFVDNHAIDPRSLRLASLPLALVSDWEADLAARFLVDDSGERKASNEPHVRTAKLFAFIRGAAAIGVGVNPVVLDRAKHSPRARWRRHISGQVVGFTDDDSLEAGGPDRACPQPSTRAEELDSLVREHLRQALLRPETLVKGQAALGARAGRPDDELLNAQLERLDRRLQQTESERRRVVDLYQMQAIELSDFQTRHQEVIGRHRQFEKEREALLAQRQELAVNNRLSRKVEAVASRVRQGIDALDFEQRQKLVRLLVEQVRVTGPAVDIHLRIPLDEHPPSDPARPHPEAIEPRQQDVSNQSRLRALGGDLAQHSGPQTVTARQLHLHR